MEFIYQKKNFEICTDLYEMCMQLMQHNRAIFYVAFSLLRRVSSSAGRCIFISDQKMTGVLLSATFLRREHFYVINLRLI